MMGGAKSGAGLTAAPATTKRAGAGTIGETAAIARRSAAGDGDSAPEASFAVAAAQPPDPGQHKHSATITAAKPEVPVAEASQHHDGIQLRRSRAGAGLLKEASSGSDNSATHLILAGRAYAYGQHIVRNDDGQKPGDVLAINS